MKYINVAYDYEYDDADVLIDMGAVDVLLVPDFVCDNVDVVVQKFFDWTKNVVSKAEKSKYPEYWGNLPNGNEYISVNSDHFVKWINDNYFQCENQESIVVKIGTTYNPDYPSAKF